MNPGVQRLNALLAEAAVSELIRCCGARRWAERLAAARPFEDEAAVHRAAEQAFADLGPEDWLEAFRAHPRIGDRGARAWAKDEQQGAAAASDAVRTELEAGNREYERRFGHIFIVCATGKGAAEMLAILRSRLPNDPASELSIAAAEQQKITILRLEKLITVPRQNVDS